MRAVYKDWKDLNSEERAEVYEAFVNTEDRNESDRDAPREEDVKDYYDDNPEKFGFGGMKKYKIELTGQTRHFTVTDEEGNEFFVTAEFSSENGKYSDWGVYTHHKPYNPQEESYEDYHKRDDMLRLNDGRVVDKQLRNEIINAISIGEFMVGGE